MNYGFKNENDFVRLINNKKASELPDFISEYLIEIFKCGKNDIFTCQKYIGHYKPDVFIKCNNKKINISIKSGDSVSVHQELFEQFLFFLRKIGISERTIKIIKFYHYGDGTIDGSGNKLYSLEDIKLYYGKYIRQANEELNNNKNYAKIISRILFVGKHSKDYSVDYVYYGYDKFGYFFSKQQLLTFLMTHKSSHLNSLHIGPFTYQPASRKNNNVKYCQFKWKSIFSDIMTISRHNT